MEVDKRYSDKISKSDKMFLFMIFMLDDYHNIHAKKVPQKLRTSSAVHIASSLLDIHMSIPAVPKTSQAALLHPVPVFIEGQMKVCHGGIDPDRSSNVNTVKARNEVHTVTIF